MPQLDTVYMFFTFTWTWIILYVTSQKINHFNILTKPEKKQPMKQNKQTSMLPWT